jgi:saccharopine dehydrogenase (NAD+, L-lysine-forming)
VRGCGVGSIRLLELGKELIDMIGIRREDKSQWEGRAPLVPNDIRWLHEEHGIDFHVQTSPTRAIKDKEYRSCGGAIVDDLSDCPIIMGVKEIPPEKLKRGKVYVYFAHVIKGQPHNMPALRRLMDLSCTLIDYERIVDDQNRRLVFFGRYAGLAGMIDSLWAFGQRLLHEGIQSPFAQVRPAHLYDDLENVKREFAMRVRRLWARVTGRPDDIRPASGRGSGA